MKKVFSFLMVAFSMSYSFAQNVGLGISTPTQKLDVNGSIQFSGALMPNGSAGTSGQVLISQGSGTYPVWGDGVPGQFWQTNFSSDSINLTYDGGSTWYSLPGMSNTFTVPTTGTWDAFIYTDGSVMWQNPDTSQNDQIRAAVGLFENGVEKRRIIVPMYNRINFAYGIGNWAGSYGISNVTPGSTYTIEAKGMVYQVGATPTYQTVTFGDPNITGKIRLSSVAVFLIRK